MPRQKITVGELVYKISGDMNNLKGELSKTQTELKGLQKGMKRTKKESGALTSGFNKMKFAVIALATAMFYQFFRALRQSIDEASKLEESINAVSVVFGSATREVLDFGHNSARAVGLSTSAFNQMASQTGAVLSQTGKSLDEVATMTTELTQRAADLASVFDTDVNEAMNAIQSGLVGQSRPLRRYAITMSEVGIQAHALAEGIIESDRAMTEQEKSLARYNFIMKESISFAGDFERTSDSLANRQRILSSEFTNLQANIGKSLLPTMQLLLNQINLTNFSSEEATKRFNNLGKSVFQITSVILSLGRAFGLLVKGIALGIKVAGNFLPVLGKIAKGSSELMKGNFKEAGKILTEELPNSFDFFVKRAEALQESFSQSADKLVESVKGISGEGFVPLADTSEQTFADVKANAEAMADEMAESSEEASESAEDFQSSLLKIAEQAKKTRESLEKDLSGVFDDFGKSAKSNIEETVSGMAEIILSAEESIKELQNQLKDTEDPDKSREIKEQIEQQEEIMEAREGFEERQAGRIEAIREKLVESGIDVEKAGLDKLLNIRSLEEEVEEERRLASLDEFTRFEEQQAKKLLLLTDNFIGEISLLREKIDTQKRYEEDLTEFLKNEEVTRLDNTDEWVKDTVDKYKQVADSLRGLLSTQAQIGELGVSPLTGTIPQPPQSNNQSSPITNNTNIQAPVTISGQEVNNLSPQEISSILGFELNKYIK